MIPAKPMWFWAILGMMLLLAFLFISNGTWMTNQYIVWIIGVILLFSSFAGEGKQKILLEEAEEVALAEMKRRKRENGESGRSKPGKN